MMKLTTFRFRHVYGPLATSIILFASGSLHAQSYPDKPVRVIVPAPPGGGTDFLARQVGQRLSEKLGKTFVVDNVPGANGNIGASQVARSAPDGYTLMMSYVGTQAINPSLYRTLNYDSKDLEPIAPVASYPFVIVVTPSLPVKSLKELVEYARAHPNDLSFGSAGSGSGGHLVGEMFNYRNGVKLAHIPYKGSSPIMTDLIAGRLQVAFDTLNTAGVYIQSGKLRALGVTSGKRQSSFPSIPTVAEQGFANMEISGWYGMFGRKGTPRTIIEKLNKEIDVILKAPEFQEKLRTAGYEQIMYRGPEEFGRFVDAEIQRWGTLVKQSGAGVE